MYEETSCIPFSSQLWLWIDVLFLLVASSTSVQASTTTSLNLSLRIIFNLLMIFIYLPIFVFMNIKMYLYFLVPLLITIFLILSLFLVSPTVGNVFHFLKISGLSFEFWVRLNKSKYLHVYLLLYLQHLE